ncbi:MAG: hypothetical protein WBX01_14745 [Nitrososphaeraceae archaeon]|jgi:hypothetical protein
MGVQSRAINHEQEEAEKYPRYSENMRLGCHECDNDDDLDCKTLNREEDLDMSFQSEESRQKGATSLKFLTSLKEIQMYQ